VNGVKFFRRDLGRGGGPFGSYGVAAALGLLVVVTLGGTLGYMTIEGWSVLDSFYMTVISLTSVGFGEVHPLSSAGKIFTVLVILGGVAVVAVALGYGSRIVLEGQLERVMGRRRMQKEIGRLRNHYIICGYGRMGRVISREFLKKPMPFVVVERDPEIFNRIDPGMLAICGNAEEDAVLQAAGIAHARGLVSVVSSDADNVYITLTAAGLRPDLYIVVRAGDEGAEKKLLRAGASKVVCPYAIGGAGIANAILRPAVVDFIELVTRREHLELQMEEVLIASTSPLAGHSILATGLRQKYGAIVVAVKKGNDHMQFNPSPEYRIDSGDRLIILGAGEKLDEIAKLAAS
jgi:voltage-gated potassium channel